MHLPSYAAAVRQWRISGRMRAGRQKDKSQAAKETGGVRLFAYHDEMETVFACLIQSAR